MTLTKWIYSMNAVCTRMLQSASAQYYVIQLIIISNEQNFKLRGFSCLNIKFQA